MAGGMSRPSDLGPPARGLALKPSMQKLAVFRGVERTSKSVREHPVLLDKLRSQLGRLGDVVGLRIG